MNKKILIIHDRFQFKGGAERLVLILAKALNADLMTEFWTSESFEIPKWLCRNRAMPCSYEKKQNLYTLDKGEAPWIVWRYFRAHFNFLFKTRNYVRNYDTIIFSGNNCLTAAFNCKKRTKKILYCHSPVRHVFDLWKFNCDEQRKLWKKIIYYNIGAHGIKLIYWLGLKMMNFTIANSENIKKRLWRFSHHKTDRVIYPPIEIEKFKNEEPVRRSDKGSLGSVGGTGDYYLSFGRIERLKRIPDIARAFQKMPDKKLVVVSGGPDLEKIREMAKEYNNIKIIGWVSDKELSEYIGKCVATIYIPINEDFGMTPLESNAAGKPCIGVAEGGLLETIIDEKTGKLIPTDYKINDLINAIKWMTPEQALAMKGDCEKQAQRFSAEKFVQEMRKICNSGP